jgi:hypothetical protein
VAGEFGIYGFQLPWNSDRIRVPWIPGGPGYEPRLYPGSLDPPDLGCALTRGPERQRVVGGIKFYKLESSDVGTKLSNLSGDEKLCALRTDFSNGSTGTSEHSLSLPVIGRSVKLLPASIGFPFLRGMLRSRANYISLVPRKCSP